MITLPSPSARVGGEAVMQIYVEMIEPHMELNERNEDKSPIESR